jgi:hypothetical protein
MGHSVKNELESIWKEAVLAHAAYIYIYIYIYVYGERERESSRAEVSKMRGATVWLGGAEFSEKSL